MTDPPPDPKVRALNIHPELHALKGEWERALLGNAS